MKSESVPPAASSKSWPGNEVFYLGALATIDPALFDLAIFVSRRRAFFEDAS